MPEIQAALADLFVGRERELSDLRVALDRALSGRGSLCVVTGEPGIGKSSLLSRLAAEAAEGGARVLWGRAWEGAGAPAFWPWIQVLRSHVRVADPDDLRARLEDDAPSVVQLLPELAKRLGLPAPEPVADPEAARFRVFDATARLLFAAAEEQPHALLFDDLQWADRPSLRLLEFFARQLGEVPVLVVAACREAEVKERSELAEALSKLARYGSHLPLRGLGAESVAKLVEAFGFSPSEAFVSRVHARTDGNPFFVDEVLRLLQAEGRTGEMAGRLPIPETVRETIRERLRDLSPQTLDVLRTASVVGRDFQIGMLEGATTATNAQLTDCLSRAARLDILTQLVAPVGSYSFVHALVRECLYEEIAPADRPSIHLNIARSLESYYGGSAEQHLGEIAEHFEQAALIDPPQSASYALRAARRAMDRLAYEEAAGHCRRILDALGTGDGLDASAQSELRIVLGEAQLHSADYFAAMSTSLGAAEQASARGDPVSHVRAAVCFADAFIQSGDFLQAPQAVGALYGALESAGEGHPILRSAVLGRLARSMHFISPPSQTVPLARDALALAEAAGDTVARCHALQGLWWSLFDRDQFDERLETARELVREAEAAGVKELAVWGRVYEMADLVERGELREADVAIEELSRVLDRMPMPTLALTAPAFRAGKALREGRLRDLAREAEIVRDCQELTQSRGPETVRAWLRLIAARDRGDPGELAAAVDGVLSFAGFHPRAADTARLFMLNEVGDPGEIRSLLSGLTPATLDEIPPGMVRVAMVCLYAEAAARAGREDLCAATFEALLPHRGRVVNAGFWFALMSVSHWLGLAAGGCGRTAEARELFEEALAMHERAGARPWIARTSCELGQALAAAGERETGNALLTRALQIAEDVGMHALASRARAALGGRPAPVRERMQTLHGTFRIEGSFWTIGLDGKTLRLPNSKGMRCIAHLLSHRGREFHATELVSLAEGAAPAPVPRAAELRQAGLSSSASDGTVVLDETARSAYRERLAELEEEVHEASSWNDQERAARAQAEIDSLAAELARGVGLGGRARQMGSPSERARINVTRVIRRAVKAIEEQDEALGRHLSDSVRTGTFCCYAPDPQSPVDWSL